MKDFVKIIISIALLLSGMAVGVGSEEKLPSERAVRLEKRNALREEAAALRAQNERIMGRIVQCRGGVQTRKELKKSCCAICLDPLFSARKPQLTTVLACGHALHQGCISDYFKRSRLAYDEHDKVIYKCPLCRAEHSPEALIAAEALVPQELEALAMIEFYVQLCREFGPRLPVKELDLIKAALGKEGSVHPPDDQGEFLLGLVTEFTWDYAVKAGSKAVLERLRLLLLSVVDEGWGWGVVTDVVSKMFELHAQHKEVAEVLEAVALGTDLLNEIGARLRDCNDVERVRSYLAWFASRTPRSSEEAAAIFDGLAQCLTSLIRQSVAGFGWAAFRQLSPRMKELILFAEEGCISGASTGCFSLLAADPSPELQEQLRLELRNVAGKVAALLHGDGNSAIKSFVVSGIGNVLKHAPPDAQRELIDLVQLVRLGEELLRLAEERRLSHGQCFVMQELFICYGQILLADQDRSTVKQDIIAFVFENKNRLHTLFELDCACLQRTLLSFLRLLLTGGNQVMRGVVRFVLLRDEVLQKINQSFEVEALEELSAALHDLAACAADDAAKNELWQTLYRNRADMENLLWVLNPVITIPLLHCLCRLVDGAPLARKRELLTFFSSEGFLSTLLQQQDEAARAQTRVCLALISEEPSLTAELNQLLAAERARLNEPRPDGGGAGEAPAAPNAGDMYE